MKRILILAALALAACSGGNKKPMETPKDQMVHTLFSYAESGKIAYGHQDDLFYGHTWKVEDWENDSLLRSDVKAVTGKYPQILGCDLGGIELGADKNLDGIPFGLMRKAVLKQVERGGMVTFSWHPRNPLTGGDAWDISSTEVVKSVLPGGEKHAEFTLWLQRAADFRDLCCFVWTLACRAGTSLRQGFGRGTKASVAQAVHWRRDPSAALDKVTGRTGVERHDRGRTEQPAEVNPFANLFADRRDQADSRGFVVDHADRGLIRDNGREHLRRCISGYGDHIQTD